MSAFAGSDLDLDLRSQGVDGLVADLDFRLTVLSDGCLDAAPEVHRVLLEKVFPRSGGGRRGRRMDQDAVIIKTP